MLDYLLKKLGVSADAQLDVTRVWIECSLDEVCTWEPTRLTLLRCYNGKCEPYREECC